MCQAQKTTAIYFKEKTMIGNNELHLNTATVSAAVEEYLNKRALPAGQVQVKSVKHHNDVFVVSLIAPEREPPKD